MATTKEKWQEIANRGLQDRFDPATRAKFDEAVRRGLITLNAEQDVPIVESEKNTFDNEDVPTPENLAVQPSQRADKKAGIGDTLYGAYENAKSIGGGMLGSVAGGLQGLAELTPAFQLIKSITGQEPSTVGGAVDSIKKIQESLSSQPETPEGKRQGELLAAAMSALADAGNFASGGVAGLSSLALNPSQGIKGAQQDVDAVRSQGLGKALGQETFDVTGSPLLATAAEISPEVAGAAFGKLMSGSKTPVKSKLLSKIETNPNDPKFSKYMVKADTVAKDKAAIQATKQGFDEGVIQVVKNASPKDRQNMLAMIGKLKKSKIDALYAAKNRPADVAGNALLERVNFVKKLNSKSGSELEAVAKNLKGKNVDFTSAVDTFKAGLDGMGVTLGKNLKPNFKGSDIEGVKGAENAINKIVLRMKNQQDIDAYGVHRMKKFIDEQVTYGKSTKGLAGKSERLLKDLRRNLDSSLDEAFPEYNRVNTTYADTITAIDELKASAGKKLDLFGDNADKSTGTLLRRLMSNTQGRVTLMDAIDSVEGVAKKYGARIDDDITTQVLFADELDRMFGAPAKTSFQGEISKATSKISNAARSQEGLYSAVTDKVGDVLEYARGINEEAAIKSMEELLKKGNN